MTNSHELINFCQTDHYFDFPNIAIKICILQPFRKLLHHYLIDDSLTIRAFSIDKRFKFIGFTFLLLKFLNNGMVYSVLS